MIKPTNEDSFYKTRHWLTLRFRCLHRDKYRCTLCGANVRAKGMARVDHIEPRKLRPDLALELSNVRTLCATCDNKRHREKGYQVRDVERVGLSGAPEGWFDS